ncbi:MULTISPECIES: DUF2069 domain-containing protein [unclassified Salinivibrio]|uniref:DUF2069 domain-containing protein n=1 Tax=unclassified Salinivibrio TaxID=2636825 RepID=UPI000986E3EE|nr:MULTISPECIES: DUF2069 domain-containing protein [unclassified Salinivibrio]OOF13282.1 hypothetical protein BZG83_09225 [Salinivibrio sp. PR919]OOF18325.1 hypothetical protein BZG84_04495 [Salinivibrio sp. PR932]
MRKLSLASNLGLIAWVALWHAYLSPHPHLNAWAVTIGWLVPLLLPLPGLIKGKAFTHAWANFILMFYFLHALTLIYVDEGERWLAVAELVLVSSAFWSNIVFARWMGKAQGLKLPRLSQVEKEEKARFEGAKGEE